MILVATASLHQGYKSSEMASPSHIAQFSSPAPTDQSQLSNEIYHVGTYMFYHISRLTHD